MFSNTRNEVPLRHSESAVEFNLSNVASNRDGHATVVSARIGAETAVSKDEPAAARYSGTLTLALVKAGMVVASATSPITPGSTSPTLTSPVSAPIAGVGCGDGGRMLADGSYSLVAAGPVVRYLGETVHVAAATRTVRLVRGILIGDVTSAPNGPWRGSGVPTCGSAVSGAELAAFARRNAAARAAAGLHATITGFEPHANGQGWFFTVRVTNTSRSSITVAQGDPKRAPGGASTAVVDDGRIVSAPDALVIQGAPPKTLALAPGTSITVAADAPETGCTLSDDYTISFPRLPDTTHFAYIDLGLITSDDLGVTLAQRYDFKGKDHRPELVP